MDAGFAASAVDWLSLTLCSHCRRRVFSSLPLSRLLIVPGLAFVLFFAISRTWSRYLKRSTIIFVTPMRRSSSTVIAAAHWKSASMAAFESVTNITQGTRAQLWRYHTLRDNYARNQRGLRKNLDGLLPEMQALPDETRESIDAITSFEMWDRLRSHQGLSKQASINLLRTLLKTVMAAD